MDIFKSFLFYFIVLVIIAGAGYWAFTSIDTGKEFAREKAAQLAYEAQLEEARLEEEAARALAELEALEEELALLEEAAEGTVPSSLSDGGDGGTVPTTPEEEKLKADLEDLLDRGVILEPGDSGTLVLRIQKFLNFYSEDLNLTEDQDFGPSTRKAVEHFQEENNLFVDGGIGPKTIKKMIEVLGE